MEIRLVSLKEIESCPSLRLDPTHYLPIHRTWECHHGSVLRTKGRLVSAWIKGIISTEDFQLAMKYNVEEKDRPITDESVLANRLLDK